MERSDTAFCAGLISMIGERDFSRRFYDVMDNVVGVDQCTAFLFCNDKAEAIVAETRTDTYRQIVRDLSGRYVETGYRRDPIWARIEESRGEAPEILSLKTCEMADPDFRGQYYEKPNIRQELAIISRLGGIGIYLGLYREETSPDFTSEDVDQLQWCVAPALHTLRKHAQFVGRITAPTQAPHSPERARALMTKVRDAMLSDSHGLTPREAEICSCIVLGYTVLGISLNLNITVNTVATHRKRAYAKMHISSQNELFAKYFDTVNRMQASLQH